MALTPRLTSHLLRSTAPGCRYFSASAPARVVADVKRLGVVGAGQMVLAAGHAQSMCPMHHLIRADYRRSGIRHRSCRSTEGSSSCDAGR